MLLVERRPPERIDVDVRGGLGQGDLAGGRAGGERLRHLAGLRAAIHDRTCGRHAPPWHGPRQARLARLMSSSSWKPLSQVPWRSSTVTRVAATDDAVGRWRAAADARRRHRRRRSAGSARPSAPGRRAAPGPRPRIAVSHGVVVSTPVAGSAVTTARTWPASSPSKRTRRPSTRSHGTPAGGVPIATGATQVDAGRVEALGGAGRDEPGQVVARDRPGGPRRPRSRRRPRGRGRGACRARVRATIVGPA